MPYDAVAAMEPMVIPEEAPGRAGLAEKAAELMRAAPPRLTAALSPHLQSVLSAVVAEMNCYYSNLIENDTTHPADIRRAMRTEYSADETRRDLQYKAVAHIKAQAEIRKILGKQPGMTPHDALFIKTIHRLFIGELPPHLRIVTAADGKEYTVVPGEFRQELVEVGNHLASDPEDLERLMIRYAQAYGRLRGPLDRVIDIGAAHQRFVWIHPFLDGNGRVARLASDAALIREGLNDGGLWALSRGLARSQERYRALLAGADRVRQGERDGRGNLTQAGLVAVADYFLDTALDQASFMESRLRPRELSRNLRGYLAMRTAVDGWHSGAMNAVMAVFDHGEMSRGAAIEAMGLKESQGRVILKVLIEDGLLTSASPKGPLRIDLPVHALPVIVPGLYPTGAIT